MYYINSNTKVKRHQNFLMGNWHSKLRQKSNKRKVVKRTVKFFSVAPDLEVARTVLQKTPEAVIKAIFNAAVNALQSALTVPLHLKPLFRHHNYHFDFLIDQMRPIALKRRMILQKAGALPIIVPLLAIVFLSIGGEFI